MAERDYSSLLKNKVLQERTRLLILSYIAGRETQKAPFMEIQKALNLTRGNLSVQIQKLKDAGYADVIKKFQDNKPLTTVRITDSGILALKEYLSQMNMLLDGKSS